MNFILILSYREMGTAVCDWFDTITEKFSQRTEQFFPHLLSYVSNPLREHEDSTDEDDEDDDYLYSAEGLNEYMAREKDRAPGVISVNDAILCREYAILERLMKNWNRETVHRAGRGFEYCIRDEISFDSTLFPVFSALAMRDDRAMEILMRHIDKESIDIHPESNTFYENPTTLDEVVQVYARYPQYRAMISRHMFNAIDYRINNKMDHSPPFDPDVSRFFLSDRARQVRLQFRVAFRVVALAVPWRKRATERVFHPSRLDYRLV